MKSVILAGGNGRRLWPLSVDLNPKQFFQFSSDFSFYQQTFRRLIRICNPTDILTVTSVSLEDKTKQQLNDISVNDGIVLCESLQRNTSAAVAGAVEYFSQNSKEDDIVLIVPSDHLINNVDAFINTVKKGEELANLGSIVIFGIKPSYLETGYGYLKANKPVLHGLKVEKFVEKPDLYTAGKYVNSGDYFWNSGIIMGKISVLSEEIKKYLPDVYDSVHRLDLINSVYIPAESYGNLQSVSIDCGILEKSEIVSMVELESDWTDVGSWQGFYNSQEKDSNGNVIIGDVTTCNVRNSLIISRNENVVISDLDGIVLVRTDEVVFLSKMDCR